MHYYSNKFLRDKILKEQEYKCKLCLRTDKDIGRGLTYRLNRIFVLDHDHKTGVARGVVCISCNQSLTGFDRPADWIKRAIEHTGVAMALKNDEPSKG